MPLSLGTRLGPYEIAAPLGVGGMGEVYRARDTRLGRDVALKVLPAEVANDPSRRQRFELEARAVAALSHPNIVAVFDVGTEDGVLYMVSELVDGEPLRGAKFGLRKTLDIAAQIASGLAAAHAAGITHRDLKPDNILLTRDNRVKILDFGLAKVAATQVAANAATETLSVRTEPGVVMGTVGYMSPEQVRGQDIDHRSDIFSFGVILHELLSGKRAFHGETSVDTMQAILRQDAPELPDSVPSGVRQIVSHCLEKDRGNRFQSAHDLGFALGAVSQIGSQTTLAAPRFPHRRRILPVLAAVALIALGLAAGKLLLQAPALPQWSGVLLGGPEMALNPRLAPDGHLLAFQALDRAQSQVAVMKPASGNWSILTHRRDRGSVNQVSWSPDGSLIYYDRSTDVPIGVYSVPLLGGEEHLVLENAVAPEALPDGSLLVYRLNARRQMQAYRFWPESGRLQELALEVSGQAGMFGFRTGPGSKVAITMAAPIGRSGQGQGLQAIDLASNAIRPIDLPKQPAGPTAGGWTITHDGNSILVVLSAASIGRLVAIPASGRSGARTLFTVTNTMFFVDAAPDQSLYVNLVDRPGELVRVSPVGNSAPEKIANFPLAAEPNQILLLPDGRAVVPARAAGQIRLMAAEKGKDPAPLVNTQEETAVPMTLAGPLEIACVIGPAPHQTIALVETASGRVTRRIAPGKGVITALTASVDGKTLYFGAGGSIWTVASSDGEARAVSAGEFAVMEPSGRSLVVTREESSHLRMFHVPLDGGAEREIPMDGSAPLFPDHGGYFSSGSMDAKGRLLVSLSPADTWFNPIGILDTATGHITRVPGDELSDHHSAVWTPDGHILATQVGLRATIWKFQPDR